MPSTTQYSSKNPTIKRILQEAKELSQSRNPSIHAAPFESNIFEWHFTIAGPSESPDTPAPSPSTKPKDSSEKSARLHSHTVSPSPYKDGLYHGRITLPPTYPLRPPSFRFLTPSGRFEVNREICLSISGHHEESWQPAWGVRTALVAIRAFMAGEAKGQLGGIDCDRRVRERMARESRNWRCSMCKRSNEEIMQEKQGLEEHEKDCQAESSEDVVPEELRLEFRDQLDAKKEGSRAKEEIPVGQEGQSTAARDVDASLSMTHPISSATNEPNTDDHRPRTTAYVVAPTAAQPPPSQPTRAMLHPHCARLHWIDVAIAAVSTVLGVMVMKKLLSVL